MKDFDFLIFLKMDTRLGKFCRNDIGRIVVHQIAIEDGLPVGITVYRVAKDVYCIQGRRGRHADSDGVKVIDDTAVLTDIFTGVVMFHFVITHLAVFEIAAMGFIDDNEIIRPR